RPPEPGAGARRRASGPRPQLLDAGRAGAHPRDEGGPARDQADRPAQSLARRAPRGLDPDGAILLVRDSRHGSAPLVALTQVPRTERSFRPDSRLSFEKVRRKEPL